MSEKSALFMARTTRFHEFARSLTTTLGVEVSLATPDSPTAAHDFDLLILDSDGKQQLIYKHAISTVVPPKPIDLELDT